MNKDLINKLTSDSIGRVDAAMSLLLFSDIKVIGDTSKSVISRNCMASAAFLVEKTSGKINSVTCSDTALDFQMEYPNRYLYFWQKNSGPNYENTAKWSFIQDGETVDDNIIVPNDFGNLSFSSDSLDVNTGGTIYWDKTDTSKILFCIYIAKSIGNQWSFDALATPFSTVIPNNGSYNISAQDLKAAGANSFTGCMMFSLINCNVKSKYFAQGTKKLATIAMVERSMLVLERK